MGEACNMQGTDDKCAQNFNCKTKGKKFFAIQRCTLDGSLTRKYILKKRDLIAWI